MSEREDYDRGMAAVGAAAWKNRVGTTEDLAAIKDPPPLVARYVESPKPRAYLLWPEKGWIPLDSYVSGLDESEIILPSCWGE